MESKKNNSAPEQFLDELLMTDKGRAEAKLPKVQDIALSQIDGFEGHPFKIREDEEMKRLVESIRGFFPKDYTAAQMEDSIVKLCQAQYRRKLRDRGDR